MEDPFGFIVKSTATAAETAGGMVIGAASAT